jgi:hypothetical protein
MTEVPMTEFSLDDVCNLLGTRHISGSDEALKKLCTRIRELVDLNGEDWVKENRQQLLAEWEYIVQRGIMP